MFLKDYLALKVLPLVTRMLLGVLKLLNKFFVVIRFFLDGVDSMSRPSSIPSWSPHLYHQNMPSSPQLNHPTTSSNPPLYHPTMTSSPPLYHPTLSSSPPLYHPTLSSSPPLYHQAALHCII